MGGLCSNDQEVIHVPKDVMSKQKRIGTSFGRNEDAADKRVPTHEEAVSSAVVIAKMHLRLL